MTLEQRQLLLKDLCARLSYGVIVDYKENEFEIPHWKITAIYPDTFDGRIGYDKRVGAGSETGSRPFKIGEVKPYLRPMSSMTEKECEEVGKHITIYDTVDWMNKHHFDYHGLIEKGLALEAPENMYKDN